MELDEENIDSNNLQLYQQVRLVASLNGCFTFSKGRFSNQPKRLPQIYDLIFKKV